MSEVDSLYKFFKSGGFDASIVCRKRGFVIFELDLGLCGQYAAFVMDSGKPVAMAHLYRYRKSHRVENIETKEKYRCKGYMTKLLQFLIDWYKKTEKKVLYIFSRNDLKKMFCGVGFVQCDYLDREMNTILVKNYMIDSTGYKAMKV